MGKGIKAGKKKSASNFPKARGGGGGGQVNQAAQLRQFEAMQAQMDEVQAEIEKKEVETTAGGGAVAVKVNGKKELVSVTISPDVIDPADPEMLQDLILIAVNEGLRQIDEISQSEMSKVTEGLGLPGGLL